VSRAGESNLIGAGVGLALALLSDAAVARMLPKRRAAFFTMALPAAAAIYPIARRRWSFESAVTREMAALVAFSSLSAAVATGRPSTPRALLAGGWIAHAAFDMFHERGEESLIPEWYPAFCAGYDVGVAGCLLRSPQ